MASGSDWSIVFYTEESGHSPVRDFLEGLDAKAKARILAAIEQLRTRNVTAKEPLVRHLEGKLWGLRRESGDQRLPAVVFLLHRPADRLCPRLPEEDPEDA